MHLLLLILASQQYVAILLSPRFSFHPNYILLLSFYPIQLSSLFFSQPQSFSYDYAFYSLCIFIFNFFVMKFNCFFQEVQLFSKNFNHLQTHKHYVPQLSFPRSSLCEFTFHFEQLFWFESVQNNNKRNGCTHTMEKKSCFEFLFQCVNPRIRNRKS